MDVHPYEIMNFTVVHLPDIVAKSRPKSMCHLFLSASDVYFVIFSQIIVSTSKLYFALSVCIL